MLILTVCIRQNIQKNLNKFKMPIKRLWIIVRKVLQIRHMGNSIPSHHISIKEMIRLLFKMLRHIFRQVVIRMLFRFLNRFVHVHRFGFIIVL